LLGECPHVVDDHVGVGEQIRLAEPAAASCAWPSNAVACICLQVRDASAVQCRRYPPRLDAWPGQHDNGSAGRRLVDLFGVNQRC
jgi:hypothetical protein